MYIIVNFLLVLKKKGINKFYMETLLEVKSLRKKYSNFLLKDISFSLKSNTITGFIGVNGSGKTTTIKLILNLIKKDFGCIEFRGRDSTIFEKEFKNQVGFVFDSDYFYSKLTINQMKNIIAPSYINWNNSQFNKFLNDFNLDKNQKISFLSRGMCMKFSLALALSHNAKLLILDEATSGLDPLVRSEVIQILHDLKKNNNDMSIFLSSHITSDLDKIADRIIFINEGKIILDESKENLLINYGLVSGKNKYINSSNKKKFIYIKEDTEHFNGLTDNLKMLKSQIPNLEFTSPTIEDIMINYIKDQS